MAKKGYQCFSAIVNIPLNPCMQSANELNNDEKEITDNT